MNFYSILAVGSGGFIGAILRYSVSTFVPKIGSFPLPTLLVNIIGSFIMGLLVAIFVEFSANENLRLFLTTGLLGALTTYSTFAIESYMLFSHSFIVAIFNILFNLIGSISAAAIGYKIVIGHL